MAEVLIQEDDNAWIYETVKGNGKVTKHRHTGEKITVLFCFILFLLADKSVP